VWDLRTPGADLSVLPGHGADGERRTEFSPDEKVLASGNIDGTVYLQNLQNTTTSAVLGKHDSWVESLAFSPRGNWLVSASDATNGGERTLELWNISKQPFTATHFPLTRDSKTIFDVAFSSDGTLLASAGEDKTAQLWSVNDLSKPVSIFAGHDDIVTDVAFSPDNKFLATASFDSFIRIWDKNKTSEPIKKLEGHKDGVRTLAFSPDGELLASGGQDGIIKIWSTETWNVLTTLLAGSRTWALAFSPDSKTLATANQDGTLGLWQRDTGRLELIQGHSKTNWSVSFSQDGKWIVTASEDITVRFWPASIEEVRELACQKAGRNLSKEEWQDVFGTFEYQATCLQFSEAD
jgi:WD40 repeat protein